MQEYEQNQALSLCTGRWTPGANMGSVADLVELVRQRDLHPCVAVCAVLASYTTRNAKRLKRP